MPRSSVSETRQAQNGQWYTEAEFLDYYKDEGISWRRARQSRRDVTNHGAPEHVAPQNVGAPTSHGATEHGVVSDMINHGAPEHVAAPQSCGKEDTQWDWDEKSGSPTSHGATEHVVVSEIPKPPSAPATTATSARPCSSSWSPSAPDLHCVLRCGRCGKIPPPGQGEHALTNEIYRGEELLFCQSCRIWRCTTHCRRCDKPPPCLLFGRTSRLKPEAGMEWVCAACWAPPTLEEEWAAHLSYCDTVEFVETEFSNLKCQWCRYPERSLVTIPWDGEPSQLCWSCAAVVAEENVLQSVLAASRDSVYMGPSGGSSSSADAPEHGSSIVPDASPARA